MYKFTVTEENQTIDGGRIESPLYFESISLFQIQKIFLRVKISVHVRVHGQIIVR